MSIEELIKANTAQLTRVADLLEVSNADRSKLLAAGGVSGGAASTASTTSTTSSTAEDLTVEQIKEKAGSADLDTLKQMLEAEKTGKNRSTAVKAIETAIEAASPSSGGATTTTTTGSTPADDKNAQPVPQGVTGDQAASAFGAWFGETDDEAEREKRRAFVGEIVGKLGSRVSELAGEDARKAVFYLRRKRAGIEVDFGATFDFAGSPTQEVAAAEQQTEAPKDDLL